ncbi:MAG: AEC family transporter [Paracoccaceae bacterium]|nr:AEC family transporter [Paracoccaceae bacterium]MDP7185939.1 AEC family transporter [Paracoccaceae bacterium]
MLDVFLQVLPFFAVIGVGFFAGRSGFFPESAAAILTKFVFYFALSAMLFGFASSQKLGDVLDWDIVGAYLLGTLAVYLLATGVAMLRKRGVEESAVEAQISVVGNVGFLGIPMLALLLGEAALKSVLMVLAVDLFVFGGLIVILITGARDGRVSPAILLTVGGGLIRNPMIVAIGLGFLWSALGVPVPVPFKAFLDLLGGAATPGALFAIGASLASKSTERVAVAGWLSFAKLVLHPLAVAGVAVWLFDISAYDRGAMIAAAALPVAGNVYILAQHYGVAPQRASAAILVSTMLSIVTVPLVIGWVSV